MGNNDEQKQNWPDDHLGNERIVVEIPAEPSSPYQERIPSGYDPMGDIALRGRAARGLAGGQSPWWVLISGWVMLGGSVMLILISTDTSVVLLLALIVVSIPLIILYRGTVAKFSTKKQKKKRR